MSVLWSLNLHLDQTNENDEFPFQKEVFKLLEQQEFDKVGRPITFKEEYEKQVPWEHSPEPTAVKANWFWIPALVGMFLSLGASIVVVNIVIDQLGYTITGSLVGMLACIITFIALVKLSSFIGVLLRQSALRKHARKQVETYEMLIAKSRPKIDEAKERFLTDTAYRLDCTVNYLDSVLLSQITESLNIQKSRLNTEYINPRNSKITDLQETQNQLLIAERLNREFDVKRCENLITAILQELEPSTEELHAKSIIDGVERRLAEITACKTKLISEKNALTNTGFKPDLLLQLETKYLGASAEYKSVNTKTKHEKVLEEIINNLKEIENLTKGAEERIQFMVDPNRQLQARVNNLLLAE